MRSFLTTADLTTADASHVRDPREVSDSISGSARLGIGILLLFFCGLGGWAALAPLNGAVVADAMVKVDGNRKSVQHLDGGIVKGLHVADGDHVKAGDLLVTLDDTQARADWEVLRQETVFLRAREARLTAELDGQTAIVFPDDLRAGGEAFVIDTVASQRTDFDARRDALSGQRSVLERKIAGLKEQAAGSQAQLSAFRDQLQSITDEEASLQDLLDRGVIPRTRVLQLQRTRAGIEGQIGATEATLAENERAVEELNQEVDQLRLTRAAEVSNELQEIRAKLLDATPRLQSTAAVLSRMEVRAPYSGTVVGLNLSGAGAVVGRGEEILDIVPDETGLVLEGRARVDEISDLNPGMQAEVRFTSYDHRTVPMIHGTVTRISADRLTDDRTGAPYYLVSVALDGAELKSASEIRLYPGMPATIVVPTRQRTALEYLVGPLASSFNQAFRQR